MVLNEAKNVGDAARRRGFLTKPVCRQAGIKSKRQAKILNLFETHSLEGRKIDVYGKIRNLAKYNDIKPLVEYTEAILQELAVRDKMNFDEKYIKTIFTSAFYISGIYTILNEFEVKKNPTHKGFVDILLLQRLPYHPKFQFVIEFKYVKQQDASQAKKIKKQAIAQLKNYLKNDTYLQKLENLRAYVVIFVGNQGEAIEIEIGKN